MTVPFDIRTWALSIMLGGIANLPGVWAGNPVMEDIPPVALAAYIVAAGDVNEVRRAVNPDAPSCNLDWRWVAAVSKVESNHGRHGGATLDRWGNLTLPIESFDPDTGQYVGAKGAAQFMDDTRAYYEATYDLDANGDGVEDVVGNVWDSSRAAALLLCDNGVDRDPVDALGQYNGGGDWTRYPQSQRYVASVQAYHALLPEFDARTLAPPERDRTLAGFIAGPLERWWQFAIIGPYLKVRNIDNGRYRAQWEKWDGRLFGPGSGVRDQLAAEAQASPVGQRIADTARSWVGRDFNPGVGEQCAFFVRHVLDEAGVTLTPEVTRETLDGWWTGIGIANSFGADQGKVIRSIDELLPGDIVMYADTYGSWPEGSITHVGIYVGDGQIVDRPTRSAPVKQRDVRTFPKFAGAVRL